jgi:hypothetical protein
MAELPRPLTEGGHQRKNEMIVDNKRMCGKIKK